MTVSSWSFVYHQDSTWTTKKTHAHTHTHTHSYYIVYLILFLISCTILPSFLASPSTVRVNKSFSLSHTHTTNTTPQTCSFDLMLLVPSFTCPSIIRIAKHMKELLYNRVPSLARWKSSRNKCNSNKMHFNHCTSICKATIEMQISIVFSLFCYLKIKSIEWPQSICRLQYINNMLAVECMSCTWVWTDGPVQKITCPMDWHHADRIYHMNEHIWALTVLYF